MIISIYYIDMIVLLELEIYQTEVSPEASVHSLGTWFDRHLDMGTHITKNKHKQQATNLESFKTLIKTFLFKESFQLS